LTNHLPQVLNDRRVLETELVLDQLPAYLFGSDLAEMLLKRTGRSVTWIALSVIPYMRTDERPLLVLPFAFDQFYWGERTAALGAGPAPIPFARLTPHNLSAAIRKVMESASFRLSASSLAERLRRENGVQQADGLIENLGSPAN
jgi:hypothetical protein